MEIETTPKSCPGTGNENSNDSRMSSLGHRHTPTLRMSERKRMLFEKRTTSLALIEDDDVDLGPMSPLQYSSSPTSCDEDNKAHSFDRNTKQTNFSNLFPGSLKTTGSPSTGNSPFFPNGKSVLFVDESASSPAGTPQPEVPLNTTTELTTIPEEQSKEMLQEKTPSARMINCQDLRVSFKKSLILGDIVTPTEDDHRLGKNHQKRSYSMSVLCENNGQNGVSSPKEKMPKLDSGDLSRARTSLTFESASIPTNKFYSSHNDENKEPPTRPKPFKRHSMPHLQGRDHREKKSTTTRRSKEFGLGISGKNCGHKIKKPTRPPAKEIMKKKVELAVLEHQESLNINESQTSRINDILRNIKNPLEMSRPLFFSDHKEPREEDRFFIPDDDEDEAAEVEKSKRKFFKSGATGAKSFKLSNNMVATVEGGRLSLPKFASAGSNAPSADLSANDPAEFSMVDEEFGSEFEEVTGIISKLTNDDEMDSFRSRIPYNTDDPKVAEKQSEVLEMLIANNIATEENFKIFIAEPKAHEEEMGKIMDSLVAGRPPAEQAANLFPIFYQRQSKQKLVGLGEAGKRKEGGWPSRKVWKKIGGTQLQLDAGQKRFGAVYCAECDLLYSVHEPEDELMHERFHSALGVLSFTGYKQEVVVRELPQWGPGGRIIAVPWNDHKVKVHRAMTVLRVVNKEMGCPEVDLTRSKTIVYFAVAHNVILGACVAEARYTANRMVTEGGVDYFSEEDYETLCGISRIWVAAPYRNQGVATELVNAVRVNFTFGRSLAFDEIAFQSPTEAGKLLAQRLANRRDFLVYP